MSIVIIFNPINSRQRGIACLVLLVVVVVVVVVVNLRLSQPASWLKNDLASATLKAEAETMDPQQRHLPLDFREVGTKVA